MGVQTEVDSGISAQFECHERPTCLIGQLDRDVRRQFGYELFGHAGRVLALVVVQLFHRHDFDRRQHHVAKDANCELPSRHESLDHDLIVELECLGHRRRQFARRPHDRESDRAPLFRRLHHHRPIQNTPDFLGIHRSVSRRHQPIGGGHTGGSQHDLRQVLIHGQRARQVAAAGVRHAHEVEERLHCAVFALAAVQRQKHALGFSDLGHRTEGWRKAVRGKTGQCIE